MPTSEKKAIVSRSSATRMPSVVRTEIAAAAASAVRIAFSPQRRLVAPRDGAPGATLPTVLVPASTRSSLTPLTRDPGEGRLRLGRLLGSHRDELGGRSQLVVVVQVVLDERLHLGLAQGVLARVDEQRPGQRRVAVVLDRLVARGDTALPRVHRHQVQLVGVLLV